MVFRHVHNSLVFLCFEHWYLESDELLVWFSSSKQQDLYDESFRPLVQSVLQGFNGTIFAYGQTGTGKTYTMQGKVITSIRYYFKQLWSIPSQCSQIRLHFKGKETLCTWLTNTAEVLGSQISGLFMVFISLSRYDYKNSLLWVIRKVWEQFI